MSEAADVPEFLNVTMCADDISDLRAYYRDFLGLPVDFEEGGHATVMGKIAVHDASEGPVGTRRLYFLVGDPERFAREATQRGIRGFLRRDGYGNPAWESMDPAGNSVVLLQRSQSGT